jgi:hypothetical protein
MPLHLLAMKLQAICPTYQAFVPVFYNVGVAITSKVVRKEKIIHHGPLGKCVLSRQGALGSIFSSTKKKK